MSVDLPPGPGADRNLLFGILALQLDFISRDALVAAMHGWVADKRRPLGQILVDQGALAPPRHSLLEALVAEHLREHEGDAQKSLSTVGLARNLEGELHALADAEVQATLTSLRGACPPPPDGHAGAGQPTSAGTRFRVLRPHARGGLGLVSVAQDEELHREVALKEIQERYAHDPDSQARFLLEAEVTGRLEHPGVVPVYGLGRFADGRPYYAMRFIKGQSLEEAIHTFHAPERPRSPGEQTLALRRLLQRFVDVCNAVAYAHSRGVIHRDIKPSNVMLGPYGETLIVDWGLAKPLGRLEELPRPAEGTLHPALATGSTPTRLGAVVGTPAYMSPEQAGSRPDEQGPVSDVYSLGATLYTLLTGRPAFEGDVVAILERVVRGDFHPPRKVQRGVPAGLEAVCLKAMALRPSGRYTSARDLADDVEAWLADEPVRAHREDWREWLGRWARRHRPLVAGAGALLLTTVLALTAGLLLLGRTQRETDRQRRLAEDHAAKAREEQQRADAQARQAEAQRTLALQAHKAVLREVQGLRDLEDRREVLGKDGIRQLRLRLLGKAQEGLGDVAASADRSAEANSGLLHVHLELAEIFLVAGNDEAARARYEQARKIAEALVRARPRDRRAARDLFQTLTGLGGVRLQRDDTAGAQEAYGQALGIAQRLAADAAQDGQARRDLFLAHSLVGDASLQAKDSRAALESYTRAEKIARALLSPDNPDGRRDLSNCLARLGGAYLMRGEPDAALRAYTQALAIRRELARAARGSARAQRELARAHEDLGDVRLVLEDADGARAAYDEAVKIAAELAGGDALNFQAQADLAVRLAKAGQARQQLYEPEAALEAYGRALDGLRKLEKEGKLKTQPRLAAWVPKVETGQKACRLALEAVKDLKVALSHKPAEAAPLLMARAKALARAGKHAEAVSTADWLPLLNETEAVNLYLAARVYALCVGAVAPGKKADELSDGEKARRLDYFLQAMKHLDKARAGGYFNSPLHVAALTREKDFDTIREREDFESLLSELGVRKGR